MEALAGPERFNALGASFLRKVNLASWIGAALSFIALFWVWDLDLIATVLMAFFGITFLRKLFLEWRYRNRPAD